MASVSATGRTFLHFTAASGDTVTFTKPVSKVIITVSVATVTVDFDGEAAEQSATPLVLAAGTHQFLISPTTIIFAGTGTATGVGIVG